MPTRPLPPAPPPRTPPPEPVRVFTGARYRLHEVAGKGGMANVWRATVDGAQGFQRTVAVKQMHAHLAQSETYVAMFVEEARLGAELHVPNIAHVYDFGEDGGEFFMVLEWIEGIDLGSFIKYLNATRQQMPWELVTAVGVGLLRALAAAHERTDAYGAPAPVIHRDVSPSNVLLSTRGAVKLIDFGLALAADRQGENTQPGIVKGKMAYLSPEVVLGARPTPACDQFAAGCVLWESLTGGRLFHGETDLEVFQQVRNCQVRPLRPLRPDAPKDLVAIIHKALASREQDRFASCREMAHKLAQVLQTSRQRRDLHEHLSRVVTAARIHLGLGHGSRSLDETTPVRDLEDIREDDQQGLWHKLPFFGSKRK